VKLPLKGFQEDKVAELAGLAGRARADADEGEPQTLTLAAPTGSGKTVIATRWMERIIEGDKDHPPDPNATYLWITDQPELNEQTRRKVLTSSTTFSNDDLVTIDADFDQQMFSSGKIYFLNTQKLGKEKQWVTATGDKREYTIWDTVNNTAAAHPDSFWVIIDEAHRGMTEDRSARKDATTIVQKFIKGSEGEIAAVPLILGISATPERFARLVGGTQRTNRPPATVDPEDVRDSELLKEAITLYHPEETQPSDLTLLRDAAVLLQRYTQEWADYAAKEKAPLVEPILVVQVEDATKKEVTKTDLASAVAVIEDVLGPLTDEQLAHSFQEEYALTFGDRSLRYVAPSDIQDDPDLRVVFFKRSLTTGWDCPRAEVMMSFRRAVDKTLIAQLVGRMVRTPLARSVSANEFLNTVSLYLPYYDEAALQEVIEYLSEPDPEIGFPTRVQRGENLVTLKRNSRVKTAFTAAESLPTIRVHAVSKQNNTRRLLRLGRLLAWDKLDVDAPKTFTRELVKVLTAEHSRVAATNAFKKRLQDAAVIDVRGVTFGYGETEPRDEVSRQLAAVSQNVDHAFAEAGRRLSGGLHSAYLKTRADEAGAPTVSQIKLELYALLQDAAVAQRVDEVAGKLLRDAEKKHRAAVKELPDERRQLYREVRRQADRPEAEDWELPPSIEAAKNGAKARPKHLYSRPDGRFSCELNTWEAKVIDDALSEKDVVGWLRNEPRKSWSFSIAYQKGKDDRAMYPDLLVFRRQGAGILCDIYEPHALAYEDSVAKAKGLAEFARDHGEKFGRIELVAELKNGEFKRLRLDDTDVRDRVLGVSTGDHLRQLFEQAQ
jgi:type III restriction enzyme